LKNRPLPTRSLKNRLAAPPFTGTATKRSEQTDQAEAPRWCASQRCRFGET
jgi:hypothetical protein